MAGREGDSKATGIQGDSASIMFGGGFGDGNFGNDTLGGREGDWNWDAQLTSTSIEGG